ncbi:MAG: RHS repeat-associated core domain-containing protein [Armatimonadetes bacterium]|nr:RHS repeat-associated core domain-containing protein [Armatimonadota bacterium]
MYDGYGAGASYPNTSHVFGYDGQWGYYTDSETGLLLLTHRYYDPAEGRFVNRDPIGFSGGVNLYGYVGNDAVMGVDPSGEIVKFCWRPVLGIPGIGGLPGKGTAHWFLYDPKCGCLGYGKGGVMIEKNNNCKGNKGGFGPNNGLHCTVLPATPRQEYCLCVEAKRAQNGGLVGGEKWLPVMPGPGPPWWRSLSPSAPHFNIRGHSCQNFTRALLGDCDPRALKQIPKPSF